MELEQMSVEEVTRQYRQAVSDYRYYLNTDDFHNWQREKAARLAAGDRCSLYATELLRRGLELPHIK
jgi:hypothetical protein